MPDLLSEAWVQNELAFPGVLTEGAEDRGTLRDVRRIQEWCVYHGFATGVDGEFGPATKQSVQDFQASTSLPATGEVDEATFASLTRPLRDVLTSIEPAPTDLSNAIIAYASQHLAPHPVEIGGANKGPWVRLYMKGKDGEAFLWCAGFTCTVVRQASEALGRESPVRYTMSCDELAGAAKQGNRFLRSEEIARDPERTDEIRPGSIFLVRNPQNANDLIHTGLVLSARPDSFTTIEGNTNQDGSSNGFEVCRRSRAYRRIDFYLLH